MRSQPINRTLVTLAAPGSFAAEQYQALRLKLERLQQARDLHVLAVTSPGISDGKTVTSINLAGALAQGGTSRVLLIDADLRRPSVGSHLGLDDETSGLADALSGDRIGLSELTHEVDGLTSLRVVLAGSTSQPAQELLRSQKFDRLLGEARTAYDFVVIDTPPLVPVCDAAVLSRSVDGLLMVVAADETPRKLLEAALGLTDEAKVIGIVFNGDNSSLSRKYDSYGSYKSYARQTRH